METKPKKSIQFYARTIHRILGYLAVGMIMIYAISGVALIHRMGGFMKKTTVVEQTLAPNLDAEQLGEELKIRHFSVTSEDDTKICFNKGEYDKTTGKVSYTTQEFITPVKKFNALHKLSDAKNHHIAIVTTTFGVVLFLLALTSLFMYKPGSKQFKSNMTYTAIGVLIAIVLVILV